jgi:GNAT superfamily N-acetyltransferase
MENPVIRRPAAALVTSRAVGDLSTASRLAGPSSLIPEAYRHVRTLDLAEHREAALSLAQAFASDDLARYLVGAEDPALDDLALWHLHVNIMDYVVSAHCLEGLVTTIGGDHEGVALWITPGSGNMDGWWTTLRSGMWRLYYQLSAEGRRRYYDELMPLLHDTKLDVMGERDDDCYYLVYLGTKPSARGRGYARALIEDMAIKADAEGRAMYLESSSLDNNAYYAKFGFEVVKDIYLGSRDVRMSIMVREPRQPALSKTAAATHAAASGPVLRARAAATAATTTATATATPVVNRHVMCGFNRVH